MTKLLGFFGIELHQLVTIAAVVVASFFGGMAVANGWATKTAVDAVQTSAASQVKAANREKAAAIADVQALVKQAREEQRQADAQAYAQLSGRLASAQSDYARVLEQLRKERAHAPDIDNIVIGTADLRRLLNIESGACPGGGDLSEADADDPGLPDGRAALCGTVADLTAGELKDGFASLAKTLRDVRGQLVTLQDEAVKLDLAPQQGTRP